jgi:hypothetical protein
MGTPLWRADEGEGAGGVPLPLRVRGWAPGKMFEITVLDNFRSMKQQFDTASFMFVMLEFHIHRLSQCTCNTKSNAFNLALKNGKKQKKERIKTLKITAFQSRHIGL